MDWVLRMADVGYVVDGRSALTSVDVTVARGDRQIVLGANGAGKSVLLDVVAGVKAPTTGRRTIVPDQSVAYVPQRVDVHRWSSVDAWIDDVLAPVEDARAVMHALERRLERDATGIEAYEAAVERFETLGGWTARQVALRVASRLLPSDDTGVDPRLLPVATQRRLAVVLALASRADLIVLDEPENDLDAEAREDLARTLQRAPKHAAVLVATHDVDLARRVGTSTVRLSSGSVVRRSGVLDENRPVQFEVGRRSASHRRKVEPRGAAASKRPRDTEPIVRARGWTHAAWRGALSFDLHAGTRLAFLDGPANARAHAAAWNALAGRKMDVASGTVDWRRGPRIHVMDRETRGLSEEGVFAQWLRWVPEARAGSLGAWVGLGENRWRARPAELSGGERARAGLALCVAIEPDVVLMDRPEADLDVDGLDALRATLASEPWTVVVRTCDAGLAAAMDATIWTMAGERWMEWTEGVEGWRKGRGREVAATVRHAHDGGVAGDHAQEALDRPGIEATLDELEVTMEALRSVVNAETAATERDRRRAAARLKGTEDAWLQAFDSTFPAPAPRFGVTEDHGVRIDADLSDDGGLDFCAPTWPSLPRIRRVGDVVHVVLPQPDDGCWTAWARRVAIKACSTLVAVALGPRWIQTPDDGRTDLDPPFVRLDDGWWIASGWALWHDRSSPRAFDELPPTCGT